MTGGIKLRAAAFALLCASSSLAASKVGVWTGFNQDDTVGAYVSADDGSALTFSCIGGKTNACYWTIYARITCDDGHTSPALMSSRAGAASATLTCLGKVKNSDLYMMHIKEYDDMNTIIAEGGVLGIAIAKESGDFQAMRFNVDGAKQAVANVIKAFGVSPPAGEKGQPKPDIF